MENTPIDIKLRLSRRISAKNQKKILIHNRHTEHDRMGKKPYCPFKRLQVRAHEGPIVRISQFLCIQTGYLMKGILFFVLESLFLAVRSVLYEGPEENQEISPCVSNEVVGIKYMMPSRAKATL